MRVGVRHVEKERRALGLRAMNCAPARCSAASAIRGRPVCSITSVLCMQHARIHVVAVRDAEVVVEAAAGGQVLRRDGRGATCRCTWSCMPRALSMSAMRGFVEIQTASYPAGRSTRGTPTRVG